MNLSLAYLGRSTVSAVKATMMLQLQPNLDREPVSFDARLMRPLRFREAISALHEIVVNDVRFKPRDKTAYRQWKQEAERQQRELWKSEYDRLKTESEMKRGSTVTPELEREFKHHLKRYWRARRAYEDYLRQNDPVLWRKLMPHDPVVTVAEDVVFFECFSADESSYGCLTVNRDDGFGPGSGVRLGTTNVDYSRELYHHFQRLRSYRETRFLIDPHGFEVATEGREGYREEKIDLPDGWLRGFMQLQAAMGMPMRRVQLSRDTLYAVLAWLKRHRAHKSPRALRFDLTPGEPPKLTLEPWEESVISRGTLYDGRRGETVRIWGRQRLLVFARVLPLVETLDVYLLGTGLPSFWVAGMGEMRLTLGLSGWTANDWTRGSALNLLAAPVSVVREWIETVARMLRTERAADFERINSLLGYGAGATAAVLNRLAYSGQVIFDLGANQYRWRQVLPMAVGDEHTGSPDPEVVAAEDLVRGSRVTVESRSEDPLTGLLVSGKVDGSSVELLMNADGLVRRGSCGCAHHRSFGIRKGPCRHLLALRQVAWQGGRNPGDSPSAWYHRLLDWANN